MQNDHYPDIGIMITYYILIEKDYLFILICGTIPWKGGTHNGKDSNRKQ